MAAAKQSPWRNLGGVMVVTGHVAVIAYALRFYVEPASLAGSWLFWVPLSIGLAVFLSWPIGRILTGAFDPGGDLEGRPCPGCGSDALRPVFRERGKLPPRVVGQRCGSCMTTFRSVDGAIVADPPSRDLGEDVSPAGITFLGEPTQGPADEPEIRFLDD